MSAGSYCSNSVVTNTAEFRAVIDEIRPEGVFSIEIQRLTEVVEVMNGLREPIIARNSWEPQYSTTEPSVELARVTATRLLAEYRRPTFKPEVIT